MIVVWFLQVVAKVCIWILGLCALVGVGGWAAKISEAGAAVLPLTAKVFNLLFDLGAWVPGETLAMGLLSAVGILFTGFCIKLMRILISLFTGGGGSAA